MNLALERLQTHRDRFVAGPVSAHLEAGDCLALMGANGAGKTTVLETLAGFLAPASGRILLDGIDVTARVPERRGFAYLPQDLALFPHLDVEQNVAYAAGQRGAHDARRDVAALMEKFDLSPIRRLRPRQLSHGQAQRVALARALAARPVLLLLDEPTASLDVPGHRSFDLHARELLRERRLAIIYATHDVRDSLSLATQLIVLDHGRVAQAGTPADLFRAPASPGVAGLLGITNVWPVTAVERRSAGDLRIRAGNRELVYTEPAAIASPGFVAIGPGEVELSRAAPVDLVNCVEAIVESVQVDGQAAMADLGCGLGHLRAALPPWRVAEVPVGQKLWVRLPAGRLRLIPASPGAAAANTSTPTRRS